MRGSAAFRNVQNFPDLLLEENFERYVEVGKWEVPSNVLTRFALALRLPAHTTSVLQA